MDIKRDIKFIVVDLDGTLLNDKHQLSDNNKAAIEKAIAQGIKVIIATGKTRKSAEDIITTLKLDTPGVFVQGLMIYNADGTIRQQLTLDEKTTRHITQYAEAQGFDVIAYCGNRLVTRRLNNSVEKIAEFGEPMPEAIGALVNHISILKINKLIIVGGDKRKLKALRWQLDKQLDGKASFTDGGVLISLEVLPKGTSKGQGVKTLLRQLDANPETVMGIGDAENDVEMLETVGFAVAVENAAEKTKAVADEIVGTNNDDGVAEAIKRFVLKNEEKPPTAETPTEEKAESSDS